MIPTNLNRKDFWTAKEDWIWKRTTLYHSERVIEFCDFHRIDLTENVFILTGKRLCAGETHARNLLFLSVSAILQNFDISMPDESKLPRENDFETGLISIIPKYFIKFDAR